MTTPEEWRPIPDWPYEVSSLGRVRSVEREVVYSDGRRYRYPSVVLRPQTVAHGYQAVYLGVNRRRRSRRIHQLVALAWHGEPPPGQQVRHKNGVAADNRPENLQYGTPMQNTLDSIRHGTHPSIWRLHQEYCKWNHLLRMPNLSVRFLERTGGRQCLACHRAHARVTYHPELDFQTVADSFYQKIMEAA